MNWDKQYRHKKQEAVRQPRIFQLNNQPCNRQPGFEYILEDEDEIGAKVYCQTCQTAYYEFEMSDHLRQCMKQQLKQAGHQKKHEAKNRIIDIEGEDNRKDKDLLYKQQRKSKLLIPLPQDKDQQNESKFKQSLLELLKFEESINKISRIVQNKSALEDNTGLIMPLEQQLTQVPCPFCAKSLTLSQLDHIDQCEVSIECQYCKDKYPLSLYEPHLIVCNLNPKKNSHLNLSAYFKQRPSRIFNNRSNSRRMHRERPNIRFNYNNRGIRQDELARQRQRISAAQLEQASRIRRVNLKGLSKEQLNQFNSQIYYGEEGRDQNYCAICTAELVAGQSVNELPCRHVFHRYCLVPWLEQRSTCPTCKARVLK